MKQNKLIRTICLILSVLITLSFAACDQEQPDSGQTNPPTETQAPSAPPVTFVPDADYAIVYSALYAEDDVIQKACRYLKSALYEVYGITATIVDDETRTTQKQEFLVGYTNRAASQQLASSLARNDYTYYVASTDAIAICGGISDSTYNAVKQFCTDVLTFDGTTVSTPNATITTRTEFTFHDTYPYQSFLINEVFWEEYTLVISSDADMPGAIELNKQLSQYTGHILPIIPLSEMTGEEASIIRIGASHRSGTGSKGLNGYLINTYADDAGNVICINAPNRASYIKAVEDLLKDADQDNGTHSARLTLRQETVYNVTTTARDGETNKQNAYMHWALDSEISTELSEGVTYVEQVYYDDAGRPYRVYTLIVDTKLNRLDMGTSNDGYDCPLPDASTRQHTQEHMEAAVKNGENVIAATNADFFNNRTDPPGNYEPWGLTIKDGILISEKQALRPILNGTTGNDRPFFGVDKNGNPLIAMESEYETDASRATLEMAVGGAYILVEDGKTVYYPNGMTGVIIHGGTDPRTVVGFREDGPVILMVIDGRQATHSNGATTLQCSLLMQSFGASDALLLDGGGSSCMVLRDPETDTYTTANSPSDGSLRRMFNSILVVKK